MYRPLGKWRLYSEHEKPGPWEMGVITAETAYTQLYGRNKETWLGLAGRQTRLSRYGAGGVTGALRPYDTFYH
jgi:hypothetical protein